MEFWVENQQTYFLDQVVCRLSFPVGGRIAPPPPTLGAGFIQRTPHAGFIQRSPPPPSLFDPRGLLKTARSSGGRDWRQAAERHKQRSGRPKFWTSKNVVPPGGGAWRGSGVGCVRGRLPWGGRASRAGRWPPNPCGRATAREVECDGKKVNS